MAENRLESLEQEMVDVKAELYESEARYHSILDAAVDAIVTIDAEGAIVDVNAGACDLFGYPRDELLGRNVGILMMSPHREEHQDHIRRYLESGEARVIGGIREIEVLRKDGSTFPAELALGEVDRLGLFTGILRDITERRRLEREILEISAQEQLRIGKELHDGTQQHLIGIGLLVRSLVTGLEKLGRLAPEDLARLEGGARAEVDRLRVIAGKASQGVEEASREVCLMARGLIPVEVDAHGLMSALSELARRFDGVEGRRCTFVCCEPIEVADNLTATHLYRIAQEAVTNAVKHGTAQSIEVTLAREEGWLTLRVRDDGEGFDPRDPSLSGTGLQIMAYRAEVIGGRVRFLRGSGGGMEVLCTAPAAPPGSLKTPR